MRGVAARSRLRGGAAPRWKFKGKTDLQIAVDVLVADALAALIKYGNIADWDVSELPDLSHLFCSDYQTNPEACSKTRWGFNADISRWITSQATDTSNMFNRATSFNQQGVCKWDHGKVTDSSGMFASSGIPNGCGWKPHR